jgi:hypothetical protein
VPDLKERRPGPAAAVVSVPTARLRNEIAYFPLLWADMVPDLQFPRLIRPEILFDDSLVLVDEKGFILVSILYS